MRAQAVEQSTNVVLHPWLVQELTAILAGLPPLSPEVQTAWGRRFTDWGYPSAAFADGKGPVVRLILIWDNLVGHYTPEMVSWCVRQGIVLLYTPLGGSWLNMAEGVQRILVRRALSGQHPESAQQIRDWLTAAVVGWNSDPTAFEWKGKRWQRRQRMRERYALGGACAYTRRPIRRRWQASRQETVGGTLRGK